MSEKELKQLPKPGDVVFTERKSFKGLPVPYKHYGIYIGYKQVVHFRPPKGCDEINSSKADIIETTLDEFLNGDELFIESVRDNFKYKPLQSQEVIKRAKSKLGKYKGKYRLLFNNCEHFAHWCKYGIPFSWQVRKAVRVTGETAITVVSVVTTVYMAYKKSQKNDKI